MNVALHAEALPPSAPAGNPVDRLTTMLRADMRQVETLLAERAASPVATIPDLSGYLISAGGKRLRPLITLASARAVAAAAPPVASFHSLPSAYVKHDRHSSNVTRYGFFPRVATSSELLPHPVCTCARVSMRCAGVVAKQMCGTGGG